MSAVQATSILIVEDDEPVRLLVRDELAAEGRQIWLAGDAEQAVELLQGAVRIDFVLTDVMMPGSMDGLALADWIIRRFPGLPVAVTSAKSRDALRDMGLRDDQLFFRKPIRFEELRRCVAERVGGTIREVSSAAVGVPSRPTP